MAPPAASVRIDLDAYDRDGFVIARGLLPPALLQELQHRTDARVAELKPQTRPEMLDMPHLKDAWFLKVCGCDALVAAARALLRADVLLFASHLLCKRAHDGLPVPLHQDAGYWPLEPMRATTAWVAIDRSDAGNGAMRVLRGSHRGGLLEHRENPDPERLLHLMIPDDPSGPRPFVDVELEPGDVSFHDPFLVHRSEPNRSARRRAGYTIRYIPRGTKVGPGWPYGAPREL